MTSNEHRFATYACVPNFMCWATAIGLFWIGPGLLGWADEPESEAPVAAALASPATWSDQQKQQFFQAEVRPILKQHCYSCHGPGGEAKGDLRLTTRLNLLHGGESGPTISLADPASSLLLEAIRYEGYQMPPKGKLPEREIAILTRWVELGVPGLVNGSAELVESDDPMAQLLAFGEQHWAFQPLQPQAVPTVQRSEWVEQPIDAFILAKLEARQLSHAPDATPTAWLRRVYYDLLGLPPTPAQVQDFLAQDSPAYRAQLVDKLLASPHYGEKWARHWLDLVRYAETNSFERDGTKPYVWRYRDYVIRSLNEDKPYNQFIVEQLAGDELRPLTPDRLIATGYYRLGPWDDEPADVKQAQFDELDDIVATTGQVFLGLTVNCARCHDHKVEPIRQEDYYGLVAFFHNIQRFGVRSPESVAAASLRSIAPIAEQAKFDVEHEKWRAELHTVEARLKEIEALVKPVLTNLEKEEFTHERNRLEILQRHSPEPISAALVTEYGKLRKAQQKLRRHPPVNEALALCVTERGSNPPTTHILQRGNPHSLGKPVEPITPRILDHLSLTPISLIETANESATATNSKIGTDAELEQANLIPDPGPTSGRRTRLAQWIAHPENPLTVRVIVNRLWQHHFGRGIVRSSSDFGLQGDEPTHPELLDWLARRFLDYGWRFKPLHREILLSHTYRMSSAWQSAAYTADPTNDLFWRFDPRRLTAEEIRDSILAVNGALNLSTMFGPSVYPIIPAEVLAGQSRPGDGWGQSAPAERNRRSLYIHWKRSLQVPLLAQFDAADTDFSCPVRFATIQPTQALGMLNSAFIQEEAEVFAREILQKADSKSRQQVASILWRVLQREPTAIELERGCQFVEEIRREENLSEQAALRTFCVLALNLNEFFYLD